MRRIASILTALCVLLSGAYCACTAAAQPVTAAHVRACCDHGAKSPAKPGRPHDPARDCPHCDGSVVSAAPAQPQDLQHVTALLPALACDALVDAVFIAPTDLTALPHFVAIPPSPPSTLLGLHCALTL